MKEFKIFNDLNQKEKQKNTIVLFSIVAVVLISCFSMFYIYKTNESVKNKFYLLESGQKISAVRVPNLKKAVDIICEGHIKNFHSLFFSLAYDMSYIKNNIEKKALFMIDNSGHKLYNELQDDNYYKSIVMSKYTVEVEIEKIDIDYSNYPYKFNFYGKQLITKNDEISYRKLITTGYVSETIASPNNLNGLKIEKFKVIDNSDIK